MVTKLSDLGFSKGDIAETVVSTYNKEGKPNAAPMGVVMQDEKHLSIDFFNSTSTYKNIILNKCAVVNLTNNVEIFYKTAFKEANPKGKLPEEWFEKANSVNAPKLKLAEATIDVSLKNMTPLDQEKTMATFNLERLDAKTVYPQVYSRAMALTIEAIIHATRVEAFIKEETEQKHVGKLLELIENYNGTVNRVAPNSIYSNVMSDLMKRIESWRNGK